MDEHQQPLVDQAWNGKRVSGADPHAMVAPQEVEGLLGRQADAREETPAFS